MIGPIGDGADHFRFIQRVRNLLEDCGLPASAHNHGPGLLVEVYDMIQEHLERFE